MEKEQTPEKITDVKSKEQNVDEQQPTEEESTEPADPMDIESEIEQVGPSPEPEPEPEPEPQKASEPVQPPPDLTVSQLTESDPLNKTLAYGGFFLLLLTIILVGASLMNTARFYVIERDGAVEIWQGRFSPKAKERLIIMPGVEPPALIKKVYTRYDVYPIISKYYLDKSETLLDVPGLPDFAGIKAYLNKSIAYATTEEERQIAEAGIDSIDLSILLYKADVSAGKGSMAGFKAAQAYLGVASELNPDEIEAALIQQKLESIERMKAALEAENDESVKEQAESAEQAAGAEAAGNAAGGVETKDDAVSVEEQSKAVEEPEKTPEPPAAEGEKKEQSF